MQDFSARVLDKTGTPRCHVFCFNKQTSNAILFPFPKAVAVSFERTREIGKCSISGENVVRCFRCRFSTTACGASGKKKCWHSYFLEKMWYQAVILPEPPSAPWSLLAAYGDDTSTQKIYIYSVLVSFFKKF